MKERLICLAVGYLFGLIQTGYFYTKMNKVDIQSKGSGNTGSTNVYRTMGLKSGLIVFFGDFLKTAIPCIAVRFIFADRPELISLMILYTAFGVMLGHDFPFYNHFKGGKGVTCMAGLLFSINIPIAAVCLAAFLIVVSATHYVSLSSLVVETLFLIFMFIFGGSVLKVGTQYLPEFYILSVIIVCLAFWQHRSNIKRLIHGNETKTQF